MAGPIGHVGAPLGLKLLSMDPLCWSTSSMRLYSRAHERSAAAAAQEPGDTATASEPSSRGAGPSATPDVRGEIATAAPSADDGPTRGLPEHAATARRVYDGIGFDGGGADSSEPAIGQGDARREPCHACRRCRALLAVWSLVVGWLRLLVARQRSVRRADRFLLQNQPSAGLAAIILGGLVVLLFFVPVSDFLHNLESGPWNLRRKRASRREQRGRRSHEGP